LTNRSPSDALNDKERRGAAVHEAGHAIVAFALGLEVAEIAISVRGDDSAGESKIQECGHLPLVDQIALCLAGIEAQELLQADTHDHAAISDYGKIIELIGDDMSETESERLHAAAGTRARSLLMQHKDSLEALAAGVATSGRLDHQEIEQFRKAK
jgi:ATP-dependent Zn protease